MKGRRIIALLAGLSLFTGLTAQSLRGLTENPVVRKNIAERPYRLKSAQEGELLTLPFFEDFSTGSVFPDPSKWADADAFINNSFGLEPVSVGVATLDAIDSNGEVYGLSTAPTVSDKLTSLPFDLSAYPAGVTLSFFYQAGGLGEVPDPQDSLVLEFYSPATGSWGRQWWVTTDTATPFIQAVVPVAPAYCQSGFRFRFKNYTSLSAVDVTGGKGALSNADVWNIDYIMLNDASESQHTSINDITLVEPTRGLMDFYESVPWSHLNDAQEITRNIMNYLVRNLSEGDSVNVGRSYFVTNLRTGIKETYEEYYSKFPPSSIFMRSDPFFAPFTRTDDEKEGNIAVTGYLITPADQVKSNDTARVVLHFADYYAYDDGTPEFGFGISGESTAGALFATRFRVYRPDTLRGVDMLFNKTREHVNATLNFQLCVWKDAGGVPGDLLYMSEETYTPGLADGMPGFRRYAIPSGTDLLISDTSVFVGWKQETEDFLNLGYDVNRNSLSRVYVNISGDWFSPGASLKQGTPMIRAVFGGEETITGTDPLPVESRFRVFPNPASELLHIEGDTEGVAYSLRDLSGREVLQGRYRESVSVAGLPDGLYLLRLVPDRGTATVVKVVVHH
jgi:hypothetical protein